MQQQNYDFEKYGEPNFRGATGLHIAGFGSNYRTECQPKLAELLLKYGADVNIKNYFGKTPLDYSAYLFRGKIKNWPEYVSLLLEAGATSSCKIIVDNDGIEVKFTILQSIC